MRNAPDTRASLLLRLQQPDDERAWQEFVEIYQPLIERLVTRYGLQPADAQDISQEVLTRVAKAIPEWEHDPARGTFRGWLTRVTRNLTIEQLRTRARRPLTNPESGQLEQFQRDADSIFQLEQQRELFGWAARKARDQFVPTTWQAFWLTAVEQRSPSEVAEQLGLSTGAVYIARSRVMARLRELIEQTEFDSQVNEANQ
ncbi:MAG: RNA polymerase sigma factor [Planctomycetota bacterium]|jgi:RNA polymerase sigma factor (sigma-70 family)|nr:sigma-70 family RNA polymerase sigma factor [Blastopirellula sp.]